MGKGYMSNIPFHIERIRGSDKKRKSCFNCKYYDEGSCLKKMTRITLNNAKVCKNFDNAYSDCDNFKDEELTKYKSDEEQFDFTNKVYSECEKYTNKEIIDNKEKLLKEEQRRLEIRKNKKIRKLKEREDKSEFISYIKQINYKINNTEDIEKKKELINEKNNIEIVFSRKYPQTYKKIKERKVSIL